jgi:hypothetical protein
MSSPTPEQIEASGLRPSNPATYSTLLRPRHRFTIGQPVKPARLGLPTDPGYERNYRQGDPGHVERLRDDGLKVGVRFADGGYAIYTADDLEARP